MKARVHILSLLVLGTCLAGAPLLAQNDFVPRNSLPFNTVPEPKLTSAEQATIERALADLQSDNAEYRAGAVMLLGKYETRKARMGVITALSDPSARVRRAALVSVGEWNRGAPPEAVVPVLRLVGDEDLEIRRTASAAIPLMMNVKRGYELTLPGRELVIDRELQQILIDAYLDEDAIVRRNMLTHHYLMGLPVPGKVFLQLMSDEDELVQLEAISLAIRYADADAFTKKAAELIDTDSRKLKLRLARELSLWPSTAQEALLRQLSEDEDDEIAAEALMGRYRSFGARPVFQELYRRLMSGRLKQEQGIRFIQMLRLQPDDTAAYIDQLTQLDDAILRCEAVRIFFDMGYGDRKPDTVKRFLGDPSPDIREVSVDYLSNERKPLSADIRTAMLESPYPDVRLALTFILRNDPSEAADEAIFDLLLDEETTIRQMAMREAVIRRMDGWEDILAVSLEDPDFQIQRAAVDLIMRSNMPGGNALLSEYLKANPDSPLAPLIRVHLNSNAKEMM